MVSKTTKKGLITAGVGIGSFLGGLAVGHFAIPVAVEALAPSWAKDVVKRLSIKWKHPIYPGVTWWLEPKFFGMGRWMDKIEAGGMGVYMTGGATPGCVY